jgi:hypothetical protein
MKPFDYNKYQKNNPLLKEARTDYIVKGDSEVIIRIDDSIQTIEDIFDQLLSNPTKNVRGLANYGKEELEDIKQIVNQMRGGRMNEEDEVKEDTMKEFTYDPQAEEDAEAFVSTPEGNKAVAALRSLISRPYEDEELQDLLNMIKLTREQFLAVAQAAGMKLQSGWGGITIKDRNYNGTTPYIEYVPDTRKWWVG